MLFWLCVCVHVMNCGVWKSLWQSRMEKVKGTKGKIISISFYSALASSLLLYNKSPQYLMVQHNISHLFCSQIWNVGRPWQEHLYLLYMVSDGAAWPGAGVYTSNMAHSHMTSQYGLPAGSSASAEGGREVGLLDSSQNAGWVPAVNIPNLNGLCLDIIKEFSWESHVLPDSFSICFSFITSLFQKGFVVVLQ